MPSVAGFAARHATSADGYATVRGGWKSDNLSTNITCKAYHDAPHGFLSARGIRAYASTANRSHTFNIMKPRFCALLLGLVLCTAAHCQDFALKTNVAYAASGTANAGVEIALAPRWTLDISGNYNAWSTPGDMRWKHWLVQPELRRWFCDRFAGHFLAIHLVGGEYNMGAIPNSIRIPGTDFSVLTDKRYQGWAAGAGLAYGYAWILGRHWNLEAEVGLGYAYTRFDSYQCSGCGKMTGSGSHHYYGPTKAAINIVYVF